MRLVIKKWGNGLAVRLPRELPGVGRLQEGMGIQVEIRRTRGGSAEWKPVTFRGDDPELSTRHDEVMWEHLDRRWARRVTASR